MSKLRREILWAGKGTKLRNVRNLCKLWSYNIEVEMKRQKYIAAAVLIPFLFSGCKEKGVDGGYSLPCYKEEKTAQFELMTDELFGLNLIRDLYVYKSYIIVVSASLKDWKLIHIYDKESGDPVLDIIDRGRGPKEYNLGRICDFDDNTGVMKIYEPEEGKVIRFQADSLLAYGLDAVSSYSLQLPTSSPVFVSEIADGKTLVVSTTGSTESDERIGIWDEMWNQVSVYDNYPELDLGDDEKFFVFHDISFAMSPGKDRFVTGTSWGGILEVFSIGDGIRKTYSGYYVEPTLDLSPEGFISPWPNENTILGFNDIFATSSRLYTVFDGKTASLQLLEKSPSERELIYTGVSIFDWDGHALKRINTDYRIERLYADEDEGMLYALVQDRLGRSYLGRINL